MARKLRVLHVFRTYIPDTRGGIQEVIRQICRSTAALDIENRVFVPSDNPHPKWLEGDGALTVRVKLNFEIQSCGFCLTGLREFSRQVAWADVVHYHFPWPFQDLMHFLCRVDKPSVMTYHADIIRQQNLLKVYAPLMNRFLDSVDRIVPTSNVYNESSEHLTSRQDRVSVIPLALDEDSYPDVDLNALANAREHYGEGFFLFIGMLRYYKCLDVLVDACAETDAKVVIAGQGPLEEELKAQAMELELDNLIFAGEVDDVTKVALLKLCRGIVFPSHNRAEAFGVTLLEGSMFGKPLITSNIVSGTSHVNIDGVTGRTVEPASASALAQAMNELDQDARLAEQLGRGARQRFDELFAAESMGRQYVALYEGLHEAARP